MTCREKKWRSGENGVILSKLGEETTRSNLSIWKLLYIPICTHETIKMTSYILRANWYPHNIANFIEAFTKNSHKPFHDQAILR